MWGGAAGVPDKVIVDVLWSCRGKLNSIDLPGTTG
jgi:hypothetical protein